MAGVGKDVTRCVAFIGSKDSEGKPILRGTMFFVARRIPRNDVDRSLVFAVTARHVLDGIRRTGQQGCMRLTIRIPAGPLSLWVDFDMADWIDHPDPTVDASVMLMKTHNFLDIWPIAEERSLTKEVVDQEGITLGEEVFVTGLFINRPGDMANIPIVRIGNVASMRDERVHSAVFGAMDAYLIEVRSIGGLSGSPVFLHLGSMRVDATGKIKTSVYPGGVFHWLGLIHGHYDSHRAGIDVAGVEEDDATRKAVNTGIGIVVPADRILEMFEVDPFKQLLADAALGTLTLGGDGKG